jgi:hypothetical protein
VTLNRGQYTVGTGQWTVGSGSGQRAMDKKHGSLPVFGQPVREFNLAKFDVFTKSKFRAISAKFREIRTLNFRWLP